MNSASVCCAIKPDKQRARRSSVRAEIIPLIMNASSITNGLNLEFTFSVELRNTLEIFVSLEKECCGFLSFDLNDCEDVLTLQIQGPPEAAHVIDLFRKTIESNEQ